MWIGTSFYFVALDNHLRRPADPRSDEEGIGGEAWEIHGGGFYRIQKWRVAPRRLPEPLHWFKWEAYTTWLSGFALLVVLYYVNADAYMIDPSVRELSQWEAIGISVGLIAAAWLVYDGLARLVTSDLAVGVVLTGLVALTAWGLSDWFAGRAVYLQVGAMLGTIMVANVFFVIIPAHWKLIRAKEAGEPPDARHGLRGKQRSVHNNYLTLPVLFTMLSPHFPIAFGHPQAWLLLVAFVVVGAVVRHYFNLRHRGLNVWPIPLAGAAALVGIAWAIRPESEPVAAAGQVSAGEAEAIVARRCLSCHAGAEAPGGVRLGDVAAMERHASRIARVVAAGAMPPGNTTAMSEDERARLVAWARSAG